MAPQLLSARSIVRYGCILLAVVTVFNAGRLFHGGRQAASKTEDEVIGLLTKQQEMESEVKVLRSLVGSLDRGMKGAQAAQDSSAKFVRAATEEEAGKLAAMVADLQDTQAAAAKLQRKVDMLQAKVQVADTAHRQHDEAIAALKKEHVAAAEGARADRSVREQDSALAKAAAGKDIAAGAAAQGAAVKGGARQQGGAQQQQKQQHSRKQGAALLPRRNKSQQQDAEEAAAAGGGGLGSGGAGAAGNAGVRGASAGGRSVGAGAAGKKAGGGLADASLLDHQARNQVLAGGDPGAIKVVHGAADAAAPSAEDSLSSGSDDLSKLAAAHEAALAAQELKHMESVQDADGNAAAAPQPLSGVSISGSGIAGAVSGMTAEHPTDSPASDFPSGVLAADMMAGGLLGGGDAPADVPLVSDDAIGSGGGGLNGAALADAHDAVLSAAKMEKAGRRRGDGGGGGWRSVIDGGFAGSLLGSADAVAPDSAAAAEAQDSAHGAKDGARELVRALAKSGGSVVGGGGREDGALLDDPVAARAAIVNAGKKHHAARIIGSGDAKDGAVLDDPVAARTAIINAGKQHHAARVSGASGESDASAAAGGKGGGEEDLRSLQRAAALRGGGGGGGKAGGAGKAGSQEELRDLQRAAALRGGGGGEADGAGKGGKGGSQEELRDLQQAVALRGAGSGGGDNANSDEADAGERYAAVLDRQAAADKGLIRRGADAEAR